MAKYFLPAVSTKPTPTRGQPQTLAAQAPSVPAPADPQALALARQLLTELQQTFRDQAAQPGQQPADAVGAALRGILAARAGRGPGQRPARPVQSGPVQPGPVQAGRGQPGAAAPSASRSFGAISIVDPAAPEPAANASASHLSRPRGPRIALVATEVRCWVTTDDPGADEIVLGGFCTDPMGEVVPLSGQLIDDDFEEGESIKFERGLLLAQIPVAPNPPSWPAIYSFTLTLVERDCEGLEQQVAGLYGGVKSQVNSRLMAIAGLTKAVPVVAVTTWVLGSFVNWMREWSQDDLIGTRIISLQLGGTDDRAFATAGLLQPQLFRLEFKGAGGHYTVDAYLTLLR